MTGRATTRAGVAALVASRGATLNQSAPTPAQLAHLQAVLGPEFPGFQIDPAGTFADIVCDLELHLYAVGDARRIARFGH